MHELWKCGHYLKATGKSFIFDNVLQWFGSGLYNCWVGFDTRRGQDNLEKRLVEVFEKGHELKTKRENRRATSTENSSVAHTDNLYVDKRRK